MSEHPERKEAERIVDAPVTSSTESPRLRVAVAMSGGLDSSVAAALLVQQGHEVVGFTAHLWAEGSRCCSLDDAMRARHVAQYLGFEHYIIDAVDFFGERIVNVFVEEYVRGRTPSPCILCNQIIKFGLLLRNALQFGCTHIATGHYARVEYRDGRFHLLRGADETKDQSYFLHRLDQPQLSRVLFPLGSWTKDQVRTFAHELNLPVSFREESQDLCFVKAEGYAAFLEQRRPEIRRRGEIVDTQGRRLGEHDGFYQFTVGQREGLGVAGESRLYVKEVHSDMNVVVVGRREEVTSSACYVSDVAWVLGIPVSSGTKCDIRLRYRQAGVGAVLHVADDGRSIFAIFDEPQFAVTPGQAAVFYVGDEVLGGGWIDAGVNCG